MVLTAGLGTRLRPLTDVRAKPAIPVAGEPMIRRIIAWLSSQGVGDLVLNLHHLPDTVTSVVGDGSDLQARVRYSWEQPALLGSAGGLRQALPIIGEGIFFVINGDTITDVDLSRLADAHAASGALVTLALVPNRDFERYGGVLVDPVEADHRVTGFAGRGSSAGESWHFVGVQVAQASVFAALPSGVHANTIGGVGGLYDELIRARPGSVRGFCCDAKFWDVGTPADYWRTSRAFMARWGDGADLSAGRGVTIAPSARVSRSILWDHVEVGANAVVEDCIITDGVRVSPGARYRHVIVTRRGGDADGLSISPLAQ
jgi:NDP-sugar pyrophosphorylase family protein